MDIINCLIDEEGNCTTALQSKAIYAYVFNERCNCIKITRGDGSIYTYPRKERFN